MEQKIHGRILPVWEWKCERVFEGEERGEGPREWGTADNEMDTFWKPVGKVFKAYSVPRIALIHS